MKRRAGILLHPTSLPNPYGIGDFGFEAYQFVDWLQKSGMRLWQILPLTIPDDTGSPYASVSAMAGNWLLISPQILICDNLLDKKDLPQKQPIGPVHYKTAYRAKQRLLKKSFLHFQRFGSDKQQHHFQHWQREQKSWLDDFALFTAIKEYHGRDVPWHRWPHDLVHRQTPALQQWKQKLHHEIRFHKYCQWLFFMQWYYLKTYANRRQIDIIGDVPFFVCHDSVDVWAHQDMFKLDKRHVASFVSGVPPDYFSNRGQIWDDPQYDWPTIKRTHFDWWIRRFKQSLVLYDYIRLDHFRGYQAVWHIKRGSRTARHGYWEPVPGEKLFYVLKKKLGHLPFIAEDLGFITHDVEHLRKKLKLPGIRVLQFAFDNEPGNYHRPETYTHNTVVYTGTHDNDTSRGWITKSGSPAERQRALRQTKSTPEHFAWKLITMGMKSKADTCIVPLQDVLNLGSKARLNKPGTKKNNWQWRYQNGVLATTLSRRLQRLTRSVRR